MDCPSSASTARSSTNPDIARARPGRDRASKPRPPAWPVANPGPGEPCCGKCGRALLRASHAKDLVSCDFDLAVALYGGPEFGDQIGIGGGHLICLFSREKFAV